MASSLAPIEVEIFLFRALLVNKKLKRKAGIWFPEKARAIRFQKKIRYDGNGFYCFYFLN